MAFVRKCSGEVHFPDAAMSRLTVMGNTSELTVSLRLPPLPVCRKINKEFYQDIRTGEVKPYNLSSSRADNVESMRKTLRRIRGIINANVFDPDKCRSGVLTYAENMTDPEQLYSDLDKFVKRLRYRCDKSGWGRFEYIFIIEPQGRGAWHAHFFLIWPDAAPFIPNDDLAKIWGHGFTKIKALNNVDNPGAYYAAYLGDLPLDDVQKLSQAERDVLDADALTVVEKKVTDAHGKTQSKRFIKGGRLFMYPPGMNIIRCSRGIKRPSVERMPLVEAERLVADHKLTYSVLLEVQDNWGKSLNFVQKKCYKRSIAGRRNSCDIGTMGATMAYGVQAGYDKRDFLSPVRAVDTPHSGRAEKYGAGCS